MAAENMASSEFKIHLYEFDTSNDTARVAVQLLNPDMKKMDYLVVGGNAQVLRQVNRFSNQTNIPLITFSLNASEIISNNPVAYAFTPSSTRQCYEAGKFFASRFKDVNAMAAKTTSAKENERSKAFLEGWNEIAESKIKYLDLSKGADAVYSALVKGKNNLIFLPSSNEDFVSAIARRLDDTLSTYQFTLIGIPTWQYFETTDAAQLEKLNTHLFSASTLLGSESKALSAFKESYSTEYQRQPSDAAIQGYDAIGFVNHQRNEGGNEFTGLYSSYRFSTSGINENSNVTIYKYHEYGLVEVK
jgi:hypothetical protein